MKKKAFGKLKRLELVELIYQLRKDNLEWRKRCKELERKLRKAEKMAVAYAANSNNERLERIENILEDIQRGRKLEKLLEDAQAELLEKAAGEAEDSAAEDFSAEDQPEGEETQPEASQE